MPITKPMQATTFLLKLTPEEKAKLQAMAREQNVSLARAMREGARIWLQELAEDRCSEPSKVTEGQLTIS